MKINNLIYSERELYKHTSGCPIEAKEYISFNYKFGYASEVELIDKEKSKDIFKIHRIWCFTANETEYRLKHKLGGSLKVKESEICSVNTQTPKEFKLPIEFKVLEMDGKVITHKTNSVFLSEYLNSINSRMIYNFGVVVKEWEFKPNDYYNHSLFGRVKFQFYSKLISLDALEYVTQVVSVTTKNNMLIEVLADHLTRIENENNIREI